MASATLAALVASGSAFVAASIPAHAGAVVTADLQNPSMPSFANVVEHVKPAVVSVKVKIENVAARSDDTPGQMDNMPSEMRKFFRGFGDEDGAAPRQIVSQGSGFFDSTDGYVVTNYHVVENAKSVTMTMDDGRMMDANVIGTDEKTDFHLAEGDGKRRLSLPFRQGRPCVGDWVVAIGNPFGNSIGALVRELAVMRHG